MVAGGVVLLIGGPGVGKTTLGRYLQERNAATTRFLSVPRRDHQQQQDQQQQQKQFPRGLQAETSRHGDAGRLAREWMSDQVSQWAVATTRGLGNVRSARRYRPGGASVLILECVDDVDDAFWLLQLLNVIGVPLLQVLYLPETITFGVEALFDFRVQAARARNNADSTAGTAAAGPAAGHAASPNGGSAAAAPRPPKDDSSPFTERTTLGRNAAWAANAGRILEFFSALGELSELTSSRNVTPSLALMGYAAGVSYSRDMEPKEQRGGRRKPRQNKAERSGVREMTAVRPQWLCTAGWALPRGLAVTPLQAVTSCRLVTSAAERDWVLVEAARTSGLRMYGGGEIEVDADGGDVRASAPQLPVPTASVTTDADVRWLCWPDRYAVSRKCDGTRHLLLAVRRPQQAQQKQQKQQQPMAATGAVGGGASGSSSWVGSAGRAAAGAVDSQVAIRDGEVVVYLLNAVGALYAFPVRPATADRGAGGSCSRSSAITEGCTDSGLPAGTILDGELVWVGGRGFFLAFDALCLGERRVWALPLRDRLAVLEGGGLGLAEAEAAPELKEAAAAAAAATATAAADVAATAASTAATGSRSANSSRAQRPLLKKQQAPTRGSDTVLLLRKQHEPVSYNVLQQLQTTLGACPYPTDGLVFTPYDMPYVLGMAELLYKWRPADALKAQFFGSDGMGIAPRAQQGMLVRELVYEIPAKVEAHCTSPLQYSSDSEGISVRWDRIQTPGGRRPQAAGGWAERQSVVKTGVALADAVRIEELRCCATAGGGAAAAAATAGGAGARAAAAAAEVSTERAAPPGSMAGSSSPPPVDAGLHPARAMSYEKLYGKVMEAVQAGAVERTVDPDTGLEVFFSCRLGAPLGQVEALCRGLVLHPPSRSLVATPFVKLGELTRGTEDGEGTKADSEPAQEENPNPAISAAGTGAKSGQTTAWQSLLSASYKPRRTLLPQDDAVEQMMRELMRCGTTGGDRGGGAHGSAAEVADPRVGERGNVEAPVEPVEAVSASGSYGGVGLATAAVKVDGWLVVAFNWDGQLRTTSQGRLDSEQALWAAGWLHRNANPAAFQPGWTYMLMAVYADNAIVVPYTFEGLVLLGATDTRGAEVPLAELPPLAAALGVTMAVPYITGHMPDLLGHLPGFRAADLRYGKYDKDTTKDAIALESPSFAGWIVAGPAPDASVLRRELVRQPYKRVAMVPYLLHPLAVWDLVRNGGASRASLAVGLPEHFKRELRSILEALEARYSLVREELVLLLRRLEKERQRYEQQQQEQRQQQQQQQQREREQDGQLEGREQQEPPGGRPLASTSTSASPQQQPQQGEGSQRADHALASTDATTAAGAGTGARSPGVDSGGLLPAVAAAAGPAGPNGAGAAVPTAPFPNPGLVLPEFLRAIVPPPAWDQEQLLALLTARDLERCEQQRAATNPDDGGCSSGSDGGCGSGGDAPGSGVASDGGSLFDSAAFQRALLYAANRHGNRPVVETDLAPSMFYDPVATFVVTPTSLRGLLLDCVRPDQDGSLTGYSPSPTFAQTWAKGWAAGPAVGRMAASAAEPPLLHVRLLDELLERCLAPLEGRDLVRAMQVCWKWRRVLEAAVLPEPLADRLAAGCQAAEAAAAPRRRMYDMYSEDSDYNGSAYYDGYGYGYGSGSDDDSLLYGACHYYYGDYGDYGDYDDNDDDEDWY